jgi:hypothetical protein
VTAPLPRSPPLTAMTATVQLLALPTSAWTSLGSKSDVAISKRDVPEWPTGALRGDALVRGFTPLEALAVITSSEARKTCTYGRVQRGATQLTIMTGRHACKGTPSLTAAGTCVPWSCVRGSRADHRGWA